MKVENIEKAQSLMGEIEHYDNLIERHLLKVYPTGIPYKTNDALMKKIHNVLDTAKKDIVDLYKEESAKCKAELSKL